MKKYIVIFLSLLSTTLSAQPEILNGNFEIWDYYNTWTLEPEFWETPNGQLYAPVIPDSAAYEGDLAMRVTVLPGFEGGVPQFASQSINMNDVPDQLQFALKTNIPEFDPNDMVSVKIEYYDNDVVVSTQEYTEFETISSWQWIEWDLDNVDQSFDHVVLYVSAGYYGKLSGGSWDTWISVDAMQFVNSNKIDESQCEFIVYPNPTNGEFNILGCNSIESADVVITNVTGELVLMSQKIDGLYDLTPGIYLVRLYSQARMIKLVVTD